MPRTSSPKRAPLSSWRRGGSAWSGRSARMSSEPLAPEPGRQAASCGVGDTARQPGMGSIVRQLRDAGDSQAASGQEVYSHMAWGGKAHLAATGWGGGYSQAAVCGMGGTARQLWGGTQTGGLWWGRGIGQPARRPSVSIGHLEPRLCPSPVPSLLWGPPGRQHGAGVGSAGRGAGCWASVPSPARQRGPEHAAQLRGVLAPLRRGARAAGAVQGSTAPCGPRVTPHAQHQVWAGDPSKGCPSSSA